MPTRTHFIASELRQFVEDSQVPFRVAIYCKLDGSYRPYGVHANLREDCVNLTVGYAYTKSQAITFLAEAWDDAKFLTESSNHAWAYDTEELCTDVVEIQKVRQLSSA